MEQELVARFDAKREEIRDNLRKLLVDRRMDDCWFSISYTDIVKIVIEAVHDGYDSPDPERIHEIDDGEYQGLCCLSFRQTNISLGTIGM